MSPEAEQTFHDHAQQLHILLARGAVDAAIHHFHIMQRIYWYEAHIPPLLAQRRAFRRVLQGLR